MDLNPLMHSSPNFCQGSFRRLQTARFEVLLMFVSLDSLSRNAGQRLMRYRTLSQTSGNFGRNRPLNEICYQRRRQKAPSFAISQCLTQRVKFGLGVRPVDVMKKSIKKAQKPIFHESALHPLAKRYSTKFSRFCR